jgi:hypothetical protein
MYGIWDMKFHVGIQIHPHVALYQQQTEMITRCSTVSTISTPTSLHEC